MRPLVIAHRGGAAEAPENTMMAFRRALALGADGLEVDVFATRDGAIVVHHDETVAIGPDQPRVRIGDLDSAVLAACDLSWTHGPRFAGHRAPFLAEVLALVDERTWLMIELKADRPEDDLRLAKGLHDLLFLAPRQPRRLLGSFSVTLLRAVHDLIPGELLQAIVETEAALSRFAPLPLAGVAMSRDLVTKPRVSEWREALRATAKPQACWSWTVRTEAEATRLDQAGIDAWITDIPGQLLQTRKIREPRG